MVNSHGIQQGQLSHSNANLYRLLGAAATSILFSVLYRSAWTGDDAAIAYKASYNLIHGFGPNYNPAERVQVYTSPLNFGLQTLAFWLTGDYFLTGMVLCLVLAVLAFWLLSRRASGLSVTGLVLCMIASRAFIDYCSSGLEVSLGYALIVLYALAFTGTAPPRTKLLQMVGLTTLLFLTRQDLILMAFPALVGQTWVSYKGGLKIKSILLVFVLGFLPIALWEVFSIIYYGFPFPNTYYAKVRTGIPSHELLHQGIVYVIDLIENDPVTAAVLAAAGLSVWIDPEWRKKLLYAGIGLYVVYVVKVGGDFMSGRFFAIPFVLCLWLLTRIRFESPRLGLAFLPGLGAALLLVSLWGVNPPAYYGKETYERFASKELTHWRESGVADERIFYYLGSKISNRLIRGGSRPFYYLSDEADKIRQKRFAVYGVESAGYVPFYIGPGTHILDMGALGDPLFSRLPEYYPNGKRGLWRPGHIPHKVPRGYQETLITGENRIEDTSIRTFYAHLAKVVRGPLFTAERFREVWLFNTGHYNHLTRDKHFFKEEAVFQDNNPLKARFMAVPDTSTSHLK